MIMMLIFHKDKNGIYIYYSEVNTWARTGALGDHYDEDIVINDTIRLIPDNTIILPPVKKVTRCKKENRVVHYENEDTGRSMQVQDYNHELAELQKGVYEARDDLEESIKAKTKLEFFNRSWKPVEKQVDVETEIAFQVVDIHYPADERMFPMRHYDLTRVNYFTVDGRDVAIKFAKTLCEEAGLKEVNFFSNKHANEYRISGYSIDSLDIQDGSYKINYPRPLANFSGSMEECEEYINGIERAVRSAFDEWSLRGRKPTGLTIGLVTQELDRISKTAQRIEPKIKTRPNHDSLLRRIAEFREMVIKLGVEERARDLEKQS